MDHSTGEILSSYDPTLKWQLQAKARLALGVFDQAVPYEKRHRLRLCYRHVRPDVGDIEIRGGEDRRPYYAGLQTCGSVWVCPVCAAKIQAYRAREVRQAIDTWQAQGGEVLMMGPTIPHTRHDRLQELLSGFTEAMRKFTNGAPMKRLRKAHSVSGSVKGLEVTWGQANGWHPHAHVLLFLEQPAQLDELRGELFSRWVSASTRAGFEGLSERAFSLQDAGAVKTYITKMGTEYQWNAEHELVKAHSKSARGGGFSPFDLLGANLDESRPELLALFREYGEAFRGKHQLHWSRGLKKQLLGDEGLTDDQVARSIGENDEVYALVPAWQWPAVRRFNLQGEVLQVYAEHGADGLRRFLDAQWDRYQGLHLLPG